MRRTRLPRQCCPVCHAAISGATNFFGNAPARRGALCVCSSCGSFLKLLRATLRVLSLREIAALPDDVRITMQRLRRAVETAKATERRDEVARAVRRRLSSC
jgi:hypothetical protein